MPMKRTTNWGQALDQLIQKLGGQPAYDGYTRANADAAKTAAAGRGPDASEPDPNAGTRMVVNLSSVHVPAFCEASRNKELKPYKNAYDLGKYQVGDPPTKTNEKVKARALVDAALPLGGMASAKDVYFGAVELNGPGIRFYGDICLVLRRNALDPDTVVLDRNSYDLIRAPIRNIVDQNAQSKRPQARKDEALKLCGAWRETNFALYVLFSDGPSADDPANVRQILHRYMDGPYRFPVGALSHWPPGPDPIAQLCRIPLPRQFEWIAEKDLKDKASLYHALTTFVGSPTTILSADEEMRRGLLDLALFASACIVGPDAGRALSSTDYFWWPDSDTPVPASHLAAIQRLADDAWRWLADDLPMIVFPQRLEGKIETASSLRYRTVTTTTQV
jgi:hypothetical protein